MKNEENKITAIEIIKTIGVIIAILTGVSGCVFGYNADKLATKTFNIQKYNNISDIKMNLRKSKTTKIRLIIHGKKYIIDDYLIEINIDKDEISDMQLYNFNKSEMQRNDLSDFTNDLKTVAFFGKDFIKTEVDGNDVIISSIILIKNNKGISKLYLTEYNIDLETMKLESNIGLRKYSHANISEKLKSKDGLSDERRKRYEEYIKIFNNIENNIGDDILL